VRLFLEKVKVIADIGINHNGSMEVAKDIIRLCNASGVNYVKFQKRFPHVCVPESQKYLAKSTLWGDMAYIDYRNRMEFGEDEFDEIALYCDQLNQKWFMSVWDEESLNFCLKYDPEFIKIPSAKMSDVKFLKKAVETRKPIIASTGGCTQEMVDSAVKALGDSLYCLMHCTSTYPCKAEEINLKCIETYRQRYPHAKIGYSNHFPGMTGNLGSVALGISMLEIHVTLCTSMTGGDHAASCPVDKIPYLLKHIRSMETMMGTGVKTFYDSERPVMEKLRT
jgi:N-acetylneuraminate synthase